MSKSAHTVPTDELIDELGSYTLQIMWQLRQEAARTFEVLGFRTARALLLEFVGRGYGQPKDLARLLGTVPPAVSTIIAELEGRGLLERQTDPSDGRRINLRLTPAGETARRQLKDAWNTTRQDQLSRLNQKDLEDGLRLCRKLLDLDPGN